MEEIPALAKHFPFIVPLYPQPLAEMDFANTLLQYFNRCIVG